MNGLHAPLSAAALNEVVLTPRAIFRRPGCKGAAHRDERASDTSQACEKQTVRIFACTATARWAGYEQFLVVRPWQFDLFADFVLRLVDHAHHVFLGRQHIGTRTFHVLLCNKRGSRARYVRVRALARVGMMHPLRKEPPMKRHVTSVLRGDIFKTVYQVFRQ